MLPDPIKKFVELFSGLPSIGPRQATRLGFYIKNLGDAAVKDLADAVAGLNNVKTCSQCFFSYTMQTTRTNTNDTNLCEICINPQRNQKIVMIVEKETDLISLEKTKKFNGRYLVLGDLKKDGLFDPAQKMRLATLKKLPLEEIVLAINPTAYGDLSASIIAQELKGAAPKITRLGRGIPTGGEIEFADEDTLGSALDNRS